jgi:uncharacterized protein (DUF2141 family)
MHEYLPARAIALAAMIAVMSIMAAFARATGEIRVLVRGFRNGEGRVGCSLFNQADGFPRERGKEYREMWTPISNGSAVCVFDGIPIGTYAVSVLHDENSDGQMDFNWIGMPTKGYGFSNGAKATLLPPSFYAASFGYDGQGVLTTVVDVVYLKLVP